MLFTYLHTNWVEIVGVILSLIYLYLSIKQKVSLWIFGFLSSALYIVVFFQTKFYADMSLQFYYLVISVYGWLNWKMGKAGTGHEDIQEAHIPSYHSFGGDIRHLLFSAGKIHRFNYSKGRFSGGNAQCDRNLDAGP